MQASVLVAKASPFYSMEQYPDQLQEADSFTAQILTAAWAQETQAYLQAGQQQPAVSPRSKGIIGSSPSDLQLRRDVDPYGEPAGARAGRSTPHSGPGSDTAGSGQQTEDPHSQAAPRRGRGRQRKNTGVETAQQVSREDDCLRRCLGALACLMPVQPSTHVCGCPCMMRTLLWSCRLACTSLLSTHHNVYCSMCCCLPSLLHTACPPPLL